MCYVVPKIEQSKLSLNEHHRLNMVKNGPSGKNGLRGLDSQILEDSKSGLFIFVPYAEPEI